MLDSVAIDLAKKEKEEALEIYKTDAAKERGKGYLDDILDDALAGLNSMLYDDDLVDLSKEDFEDLIVEYLLIDKTSQRIGAKIKDLKSQGVG